MGNQAREKKSFGELPGDASFPPARALNASLFFSYKLSLLGFEFEPRSGPVNLVRILVSPYPMAERERETAPILPLRWIASVHPPLDNDRYKYTNKTEKCQFAVNHFGNGKRERG